MATLIAPASHAPLSAANPAAPEISASNLSRQRLDLALFLVAFALRFGFVLWKHTYIQAVGNILPWGAEVCSIAQRIAEGRGFNSPFFIETGPSAWIAPLYPLLVAGVFKIFGVFSTMSALVILFLQCLMAAGTAVAIYALGLRSFGPRVALWAAWIWAIAPIYYRWPVSWIWDFTASALLLSLAFIVTIDAAKTAKLSKWLLFGAIWALIALTNPALLSIMPFAFIYAAYTNYKSGASAPWLRSMVCGAFLFAAMVSPWLIRNYRVFHQPVFFRSNYWFEFHLGNYHGSNGIGYSGKHPNLNHAVLRQYKEIGELAFIKFYKDDALAFVRKYPQEFIDLTLQRTVWFWDGTPLNYYGKPEWWVPWKFWPLSVIGLLGFLLVLTRRPTGWLLFAAAILVYPIPYYLAYPFVKYRHAIEPELLLMSVYLVFVLWDEITNRRGLQRAH